MFLERQSNTTRRLKKLTREERFQQLESWTNAFMNTVKDTIPEMRRILEGQTELPDDCPSKESMAQMVFRQVEERFSEVENAMKLVRATLRGQE